MKGRKAPSSAPASTVAYARVSTLEQATRGVSLAAQRDRIIAYCNAMGWDLHEVITDSGESAKTLKRPGVAKILERVRLGVVGRIVVLKLDRMTRSTRDLAELLEVFAKFNVALVSVSESLDTQSAAGRLVVNMLGVVAQWEREAIGERTATALAHKRRESTVYGHTPFGYRRVGNRLVPDAKQQRALQKAQAMHARGASLRQIGARLEAMQVKPNNGGRRWHPQSVKWILSSKMTCGE